jgi:hypothetical protein
MRHASEIWLRRLEDSAEATSTTAKGRSAGNAAERAKKAAKETGNGGERVGSTTTSEGCRGVMLAEFHKEASTFYRAPRTGAQAGLTESTGELGNETSDGVEQAGEEARDTGKLGEREATGEALESAGHAAEGTLEVGELAREAGHEVGHIASAGAGEEAL